MYWKHECRMSAKKFPKLFRGSVCVIWQRQEGDTGAKGGVALGGQSSWVATHSFSFFTSLTLH